MALILSVALLWMPQAQSQSLLAGRHHPINLSAPTYHHSDRAAATQPELTWSHVLCHTGASYVALHFESFDLGAGNYLKMSDRSGGQGIVLEGQGRMREGGFWAQRVNGDTIVLQLFSSGTMEGRGFKIDQYSEGLPQGGAMISPESVIGGDDKENAICYYGTMPYVRGEAVARLLIHRLDGDYWGTGFLVSSNNDFLTAQHVITSAYDALNTEYEFMAEAPYCFSYNCYDCWSGTTFYGANLIRSSANLDYTLVRINSGSPATFFGYLEVDDRPAIVGEQIYIPQHPQAWAKQFAFYSSEPADFGGVCRVQSVTASSCLGTGSFVGYYADTDQGASGSPVIAYSSHKVIALHHCGVFPTESMNTGVPIQSVWNEIKCLVEQPTISPDSWNATANGGSIPVNVTAASGCSWSVTNSCSSWAAATPMAGVGPGVVTVSVSTNLDCLPRTCPLTVAGTSFQLTQSAGSGVRSISPTSTSLPATARNGSFLVTATAGCPWTGSSHDGWITITSSGTGTSNGTVGYSVLANANFNARTGTVTIADKMFTVNQAGDTVPPSSVSITNPANGTTYTNSRTVAILASATDNVGVVRVEFYDKVTINGTNTTPPYRYDWTFGATNNGSHIWTVRAYDAAGNVSTSGLVTLNISIDVTPPTVAIASPTNGQTYTAAAITISGTAADPGSPSSGLSAVEIRTNGASWMPATGTTSWNRSVTLSPCGNTVEARSRDKAGNYSVIGSVSVSYNAPNSAPDTPTNTSPPNGAANVSLTPTLQATRFSDPDCTGDAHAASEWLVLNTAGTLIVVDSGTDTVDRTSWTLPPGKLYYGSNYQWRVRYRDSRNAWSSNSAPTSFTTSGPWLIGAKQETNLVFTWPTNALGFKLQYATNLTGTSWTTNPASPVVVNGQNVVTNPIFGSAKFYRLRKP